MALKSYTLPKITILAAGTRQAVSASSNLVQSVIIEADSLNSGKVYVGDSSVSSENGVALSAGQSFIIEATPRISGDNEIDLADIYVDTETNDNVVRVQYLKSRSN